MNPSSCRDPGHYLQAHSCVSTPKPTPKHKEQVERPRTIIVDDGSDQLVPAQHGEQLQGPGLGQDIAALQALAASHQVIHLDPNPVVRQLPPPEGEKAPWSEGNLIEMKRLEERAHAVIAVQSTVSNTECSYSSSALYSITSSG